MSTLSLDSSRSMMAVFLASWICWRLSERPGHIVLTFQVASCKAGDFLFLCCLPGAGALQPACRFCLSFKHPMEQAGCGGVATQLSGGCPA